MSFSRKDISKYTIYGVGVLLAAFGITGVVFGILILAGNTCLLLNLKNVVACGSLLIVGGIVMFFTAFFAYWAALKESLEVLRAFYMPEIIVCVSFIVFMSLLGGATNAQYTKERLETALNNYGSSKEDRAFWKKLQRNYKCCGIDGYGDWESKGIALPESCCQEDPSDEAQDENETCKSFGKDLSYVYNNGCRRELVDAQNRFYYNAVTVACSGFVCYLILWGAAYCLLCAMVGRWVFL